MTRSATELRQVESRRDQGPLEAGAPGERALRGSALPLRLRLLLLPPRREGSPREGRCGGRGGPIPPPPPRPRADGGLPRRRADSVGVAAATEVASIGELAARRCLSAIEISTGWLVRWLPNMPEATRSVAGSEKPSIATRLAVDSDLAADCQNSLVIGFL